MAACIVCNCQTTPGDLPDVGDMVSPCARLEKVLDEVVPMDSVMCSSCEFDLAQIEMYYTLLTVFKKRYSETAKLRLQSLPGDTSRNLLYETAGCTSNNLQSVLGARDSSDNSHTGLLLQSNVLEHHVSPENSSPVVKIEIHDVRTVKDELQGDDPALVGTVSKPPTNSVKQDDLSQGRQERVSLGDFSKGHEEQSSSICGQDSHDTLQIINTSGQFLPVSGDAEIQQTYSDGSIEATAWESDEDEAGSKNKYSKVSDATPGGITAQVIKKRGRPRKISFQKSGLNLSPGIVSTKGESRQMKQSNVVSSLGMVAIPRKRGRPRKDAQSMGFRVSTKSANKCGMPQKEASESSIKYAKKPGRPRKYKRSGGSQHIDFDKESVMKKETSVNFGDSESEECSLGGQATDESDADDPSNDPKLSAMTPTVALKVCVINERTENKSEDAINFRVAESDKFSLGGQNTDESDIDDPKSTSSTITSVSKDCTDPMAFQDTPISGGPPSKKKTGRPKKKWDTSNVPAVVQKKKPKPKQSEESPCSAFTCTVCDKVFNVQWKLAKHMTSHSDDRPFECSVCNKGYKTVGDLNAHKRIHMEDKPFKCDICGKAFLWEKLLKGHLVVHSDARPFQCDQCERKFKTRPNLKFHIKVNHVDGKKYLCPICGFALTTEGSLRNHMKTHSDEKPFKCETCDRCFSTLAYLTNHELIHNADTREKYLCPICGKELLNKYYLGIHMKRHEEVSKHTCSVCNKSFLSLGGYKLHMMMHRGEKNHTCPECGKGFAGKGNLNQHMMSHTDERPHKCSCGQGFRTTTGLGKHTRRTKHVGVGKESVVRQVSHTVSIPTSAAAASPCPPVPPLSVAEPSVPPL